MLNAMTIRNVENAANRKLRTNGHLFLNEVIDMLDPYGKGCHRTAVGQVAGWIYDPKDETKQNCVSLGTHCYVPGNEALNDFIFNMMDAARYQGNIDWDAVKASGKVDCVLLKTVSTNSKLSKRKDGLYIDPTFERNYAECKRVGLPVGVYYYTYATTKAMADAELAVLKTALAGKTFEMPVCVDVEDNKLVKLNKGSLTALVDYELRTLESWSVYALLYTGLNFSLTRLNMAKLKAYDVWVAAYRKSMKKPATSYKYGIWQYTDEARIPGVRTNADMSYAYKDYPAIIERAGLSRVKGA